MAQRPERILLQFRDDAEITSRQLSAVVQVGEDLLLGSDEGRALERLSPVGDSYAAHTTFALEDYVTLPAKVDEEVDIEGLAASDGWLWFTGSHSAKRRKPKRSHDTDEGIAALAKVEREGNRYLLGRIPLVSEGGKAALGKTDASRMVGRHGGSPLIELLQHDAHLAPFLTLPGKDNGFNIEGFAVGDGRVYLGLRGPVLRGYAVILEALPQPRKKAPRELKLKRLPDEDGRRYTKHFLSLHGLGIRELVTDGRDLLVLAGPTMILDGHTAVFRWRGALDARGDSLLREKDLEHVMDLPSGRGNDRPEGLALVNRGGRRGLLVVYDAPAEARCPSATSVYADFYPL